MTPTSVASSTPPTARSPTRCTCKHGILSYTIELDGGSGAAVGGTTTAGNAVGSNPGGFVFQDREADVAGRVRQEPAVHARPREVAPTPGPAVLAHRHADPGLRPGRVPDVLRLAADRRGQRPPRARRRRRSSGTVKGASTADRLQPPSSTAASATASPASTTTSMRGSVTGFTAGDKVEGVVRGAAARRRSRSRSPRRRSAAATSVLDPVAPRTTPGCHPNTTPTPARSDFLRPTPTALADAGIPADVYDIDAQRPQPRGPARRARPLPGRHLVHGHRRLRPRPRPDRRHVSKLFDDQLIAVRDYLNEGGKVLVTGQRALDGAWSQYAYNPLGRFPDKPQCRSNTNSQTGQGPIGQLENCVQTSPTTSCSTGWAPTRGRRTRAARRRSAPRRWSGQAPFTGTFSLTGQSYLPRFTPISSALSPAAFPHFASAKATHTALIGTTNGNVGVSTDDTLLWGFGLENIADRATHARRSCSRA